MHWSYISSARTLWYIAQGSPCPSPEAWCVRLRSSWMPQWSAVVVSHNRTLFPEWAGIAQLSGAWLGAIEPINNSLYWCSPGHYFTAVWAHRACFHTQYSRTTMGRHSIEPRVDLTHVTSVEIGRTKIMLKLAIRWIEMFWDVLSVSTTL